MSGLRISWKPNCKRSSLPKRAEVPVVISHRCPQDHPCPCVRMCPEDAVIQHGFAAPEIDKNKCVDCGACVDICPYKAITDMPQEKNVRMTF